ncbi:unnamed protein product [Rotaria magnacalcarata]|uniref:Polypeptide N-acetylgalactosaminyltransferase n=1 Tax=Rotaria magnacalcarata TaxID=392030 RepID=A0A816KLG7_9BILA|nr:unnamed protein product [Rotaria magnacalcarata]CAF1238076.1 unnamed protein product [Rotaria magnacalcarata]CAF1920000.1 unnamed protein product [Rotaria magnacalcarata]CAF3950573.1 unnamed protein product [Rotaria magnacalcarata]CAF3969489.1 unnamed protein product [Rotaria magnacalcarata]
MKKRSGGATQSSSSSSPSSFTGRGFSKDTMPPNMNRRFESRMFSNERLQTIILTSLIWIIIVFIAVLVTFQYNSSNNCLQNSLLTSAFCNIGQVLTRFCSDSYQLEQSFTSSSKSHPTNFVQKPSKENIVKIKFNDAYEEETCQKNGQCSNDDETFLVPDQFSQKYHNPSNWPGEMGEAYLPPEHLLDESKRRFAENMFDIVVSDQIALNRAMPDIRNEHCKAHSRFGGPLPNTSIIIVFHNEGNSTLLRTLVSIINRTPWKLIHEIILLDDASVDREYLHEPLETFIKTLPVRTLLLRNEKRLGLISSRVKAANIATGQTLMFLDSHVEVLNGWLLYLLEEIKKDRKTIVCPIIDVLTWDAFQLLQGATDIFGTFSWKMIFRWSKVQGFTMTSQALPIKTPTMAGGLYAIDRLYFEELGMYDEGIKIWGGENLEMSFKCWMCGGRILIHPCSHVAHVFRKETPYKFLESESVFVTIFKNYKRVALVWLDEYKQLIYAVNPDIKRLNGGDVSDRLQLRQKLNCSSFKDYLKMFQLRNFPFNHRFIGTISTSNRRCLDSMMGPDISKGLNTQVSAQACHKDGGNQIFLYTTTNKIHFDELCLEPGDGKPTANRNIIFAMCTDDRIEQHWEYDQQTLQLKNEYYKEKCLSVAGDSNVILTHCDINDSSQKWTFNQEVELYD